MTTGSATTMETSATSSPVPSGPVSATGTKATRVIGALVLIGLPILVLLGLVASPEDVEMGDSVRIMYVHVPSAWLAYLAFGVTALCSSSTCGRGPAASRWTASPVPRPRSACCSPGWRWPPGCCGVGRRGACSGRGTPGSPARRCCSCCSSATWPSGACPAPPEVRAKRAAIAGLIAFIDVPIVHLSVDWWRSLHQGATVARRDLDAQLDGTMLFTLFFGLVVFTLIYVWLLLHRQRQLWLEDHQGDASLERAIAERRAEARPT